MHKNILVNLAVSLLLLTACSRDRTDKNDYPITPVPFTHVRFSDGFWAPRLKVNHEVTIPLAFQKAEETGRIKNFKVAGGKEKGSFCSLYPFDDSDVYKNIEAASYSLQIYPDPSLEAYLDTLIASIASAQEKDGYLYTNRTINPDSTHVMAGSKRWEKVEEGSHELYNLGHLYEAAVAHYQATGKRNLLDVALKSANLVDSLFGWGKIEKVPGHQEIEIGLVKLYRVTGEQRYLDLAKFFLDKRGPGGKEYAQMHKKVTDQDVAVGHAVRAQYMYSAMADVAALTGDSSYLRAIKRIWNDVTGYKTYITGGIGAAGDWEGFGPAYYLPNMDAYCETCAAISNAFWNYRMFLLEGDSKYLDVFERVLYNGLLSGVSLSGDHFFYPNPLASDGQYQRKEWFGCACCPVNITRFLPSLPGYVYAVKADSLYINLFIGNEANIMVGGRKVNVTQKTTYPWDGTVDITIDPAINTTFTILVRYPGWARNEAFPSSLYGFADQFPAGMNIELGHEPIEYNMYKGFASITRKWHKGDVLHIKWDMPVRQVLANPHVEADRGCMALQRGPLVYAAEWTDQPDHLVSDVIVDTKMVFHDEYMPNLLGGVEIVTGKAMTGMNGIERSEKDFTAIPYYAWANRGPGEMRVWLLFR